MKLFWEKGFEGTSMNDLAVATGMAKPGLYATFGDKEALYTKALTHYFTKLGSPMLEDLVQSPDRIDVVIRRFLDAVVTSAFDKTTPGGCFVANSIVECASHPAPLKKLARRFDARRHAAFLDRLRTAKTRGELPDDADVQALADFFSGQVLALAVMGRAGADRAALNRVVDVAMKALPTD